MIRSSSSNHNQDHHNMNNSPLLPTPPTSSPSLKQRGSNNISLRSSNSSQASRLSITKPRLSSPRNIKKRLSLGWTINKLRFSNVKIYGRTKEIDVLEECLERLLMCSSSSSSNESLSQELPANASKTELVLIDGYSGTGKSALAMTLKTKVVNKTKKKCNNVNGNGIFATGKFDFEHRDQPYGGIIEACCELCKDLGKVEVSQPTSYEQFKKELQNVFRTTDNTDVVPSLMGIIPLLGRFLERSDDLNTGNDSEVEDKSNEDSQLLLGLGQQRKSLSSNKDRWHYYFCEFFRVMTSLMSPIVIVLDDLQWADSGSLELLELLVSRKSIRGLMIIGCFRSNEVDESHILSTVLRDMKSKTATMSPKIGVVDGDKENENKSSKTISSYYNITEISIGNLEIDDVNHILMDLLAIDEELATIGLAQICHKRTLGNPFFCIAFISMLEEKSLLEYNFGLMKWIWNIDKIEANTVATTNVVDLTKTRIVTQLSLDVSRILQLAACLGTSFDERLISLLWEEETREQRSSSLSSLSITDLDEKNESNKGRTSHVLLKDAIEESFLESKTESCSVTYRWTHDKIQEAAMSLVHPDEQDQFKARAGSILMHRLSCDELESSIFIVCNLLNSGPIQPSERQQRFRIAELNLQAAKKAMEVSAFSLGNKFALKGIEMLPQEEDCWKTHKTLCLDLYSTAIELENIGGQVDQMQQHCKVVLQQPEDNTSDLMGKLRVYYAMIDSYGNCGRLIKARDLCFQCLAKLGCNITSNPVLGFLLMIKGLLGTQKRANELGNLISSEQQSTTTMDLKHCQQMKLLDLAITLCYRTGVTTRGVNAGLRMLQLSIDHGICELSPVAFTVIGGMMVIALSDFEAGAKYARFSEELLQKNIQFKAVEARCVVLNNILVYHYSRPLSSLLKPLLRCYNVGLQAGDNESAMMAIVNYCIYGFASGKPLECTSKDLEVYTEQMAALEKRVGLVEANALWKFVVYLMSSSDGESVLDLTDRSSFSDISHDDANGGSSVLAETTFLNCLKTISLVFFGDHKTGADCALKRGDDSLKNIPALAFTASDPFYKALSLVAQVRMEDRKFRKRRRYRREAIRLSKMIKKWVRGGNPNLRHHESFIDAELSILNKKPPDETKALFQKTITQATRSGIIHEAALANERYGHYLLHDLEDTEEAIFRFKQAKQLYSEWGAYRKVKMMETKYSLDPFA